METANRLYVIANPLGLQIDEETEEVKEVTPSNVASDWALAEDAVARLAANGIMNGTSTTTLSSQDTTSVEMSLLLLYRISLLA